jgi:malate dehydrogenase (oxaloacetate-decarboxylating)
MKRAAAGALAALVNEPVPERIIPGAFEPGVAEAIAESVKPVAIAQGHVRS